MDADFFELFEGSDFGIRILSLRPDEEGKGDADGIEGDLARDLMVGFVVEVGLRALIDVAVAELAELK